MSPSYRQIAVLVGLLLGVGATPVVQAQVDASGTTVAATTDPLAALGEMSGNVINMILVKVNGDPILLSDLRDRVEGQLEAIRAQLPEAEIEAQLPAIRMSLLQGLIDERMMTQRAERLGITVGANEIDAYVQNVKSANQMASDEELEAQLATYGMTMADLREQARTQMLQQQLVYQEAQRASFVSESDIVSYFDENRDQFTVPEQVRLEQLVFIGSPNDAELAAQAAAAAAELQGGADLDSVGAKYVNATAMADQGTFVKVSDLTEGLASAMPTLQTGVYSDPIKTNFGLQLVKVVERHEPQTAELDAVRDQIRNLLTTQRGQEQMQKYLNGLRAETRLQIMDSRLNGLDEAWKTAPDDAPLGRSR